MIERLQHALQYVDTLPINVQEEIAEHIETFVASPKQVIIPADFAGIWSDIQDDDEVAALDHMRHAN